VSEFERIYVRCPNWVGDVVMATPALRALAERFPGAELTVGVRASQHGLLRGLSSIGEMVAEDRSSGLWESARALRQRRFDLAVILPNSLRTALAAWLARVPERIGYALNGRRWTLTRSIRPERQGRRRRPVPMPIYYLELVRLVGCERDDPRPELAVTAEEAERAEAVFNRWGLRDGDRLIGINPGASFGSSKLWYPERFAAVADAFSRQGRRVVLLVGPGEEPLAREIERAAAERLINTASDVLPLDLLKPVIRRLELLVTNDTGPRHIAVAFDVPAVVLMGPTDPRYTAYCLDRTRVIRFDVPCGPCHLKRCPLDHRCMKAITPDHVLAAAGEIQAR